MSTVSSQIQRAMIEANSDQILPQMQATLRSGNGQMPERRWEVPPRRQGFSSEEALNRRFRNRSKHKCNGKSNTNEILNNVCGVVTVDNESPNMITEFLTGQIPSRSAPNHPSCDHNGPLTPPYLQQNQLPQWLYKTQFKDWLTS